jgi:hypothetical protein
MFLMLEDLFRLYRTYRLQRLIGCLLGNTINGHTLALSWGTPCVIVSVRHFVTIEKHDCEQSLGKQ